MYVLLQTVPSGKSSPCLSDVQKNVVSSNDTLFSIGIRINLLTDRLKCRPCFIDFFFVIIIRRLYPIILLNKQNLQEKGHNHPSVYIISIHKLF